MAGGNTMKLEEIRKMARNTGTASFFKSLYQHSTQILESLSEDKIRKIFRPRMREHRYEDTDVYGQTCELRFSENGDDTKISVGVMYAINGFKMEESILVQSSFDYRGLYVALHFDENAETVRFASYKWDDENEIFLRSLTDSDYLKKIFGKYLIKNSSLGNFVDFSVSIKWFED